MTIVQALIVASWVLLLIVLTVKTLIPRAIVLLGNVDSWWSPFRTLPPPGEMYILVRGDPDGPYDTVIESVIDYGYDPVRHLFVPDMTPKQESYLRSIGVEYVGLWKYFLWREVRYDKWEKLPGKTEWGLVPKVRGVKEAGKTKKAAGDDIIEEKSPSIFFQYNMATKIEAAETLDNFPVDAIVVFTVQIENPVQAFFFAGGWESQTNAAVQGVFREYVSRKSIEDLRKEEAAGANNLVSKIKALNNKRRKMVGLRELYGINIVDARFVKFDLITGDAEMTKAIRAVGVAKEKANARREEAKGNKDAAITEAEGKREALKIEAEGITVEYAARASQPDGAKFAMAEAIKVAQPAAIGGDVLATINAERRP